MEKETFIYNGNKTEISIGDKINRLKILDLFYKNHILCCKCECECGKIVEKIVVRNLFEGNTKSCGCLNRELTIERNFKHGDGGRNKKTRLYKIWVDMRRRCNNPNRKDADNYYNKNIKVCEKWSDFNNFKKWALENGYNDNLTIERKDNNENYCPENCSWIEKSEQSKNRTSNHYITYKNETKTLSDWSLTLGISRTTIQSRLRRGWSIEKTFETPVIK